MELKDKEKIVKVIGSAEAALDKLEKGIRALEAEGKTPPKDDTQLLRSIYRALDLLKFNPFAGEPIPHKLWPGEFSKLPNLFRLELSRFWRLLYYVVGDEVQVISVIFEIGDHEHYDKIFGYTKR